jgi:hypothetical protein
VCISKQINQDFMKMYPGKENMLASTWPEMLAKIRRGSRNFWWGHDMDEEKIGRGLGAAVDPQRGPGAGSLVGVKGAKPPIKVTLFSRVIQRFCTFK